VIINRLPQVSRERGGFFIGKFEDYAGDMARLTIPGKSRQAAVAL
jgi:hypothetical protein